MRDDVMCDTVSNRQQSGGSGWHARELSKKVAVFGYDAHANPNEVDIGGGVDGARRTTLRPEDLLAHVHGEALVQQKIGTQHVWYRKRGSDSELNGTVASMALVECWSRW